MGIEKAESILAPSLFILNLPVALAREPGKIANWEKVVAHAWCQPDTNGRYKDEDPKKCHKCLLVAESHIGVQTDLSKKEKRKKEGISTALSHNHDWNYWCPDGLSC